MKEIKSILLKALIIFLIFTFVCATMGFIPQDAAPGTKAFDHQLFMNFVTVGFLVVLGFLLPWLRKLELKRAAKK